MKTVSSQKDTGFLSLLMLEFSLLKFDKWLLVSISLLPFFLYFFLFSVFSSPVMRNLPLAVVDLDDGGISRMLVRTYDASSHLQVQKYASVKEAVHAMRTLQAYALVVIPRNMEKDLRLGKNPQVQVFYNFQFVSVGKIMQSAMIFAHSTFNAQIATIAGLARGNVQLAQAMGSAIVTQKQITPLYNLALNYGQFLITSLVPSLWQILIVAVTILVWAAEERRSGLVYWIQDRPIMKVAVRLGLYYFFFLVQGLLFFIAFLSYNWRIEGGILQIFLAQSLMIVGSQLVGTLLFWFFRDASRSLSLAAAYVAPSFAFLGVTFPANDMQYFAKFWNAILPVTYYMKVQIGVMNYGVSFVALSGAFLALSCFLLLAIPLVFLIRKRRTDASAALVAFAASRKSRFEILGGKEEK